MWPILKMSVFRVGLSQPLYGSTSSQTMKVRFSIRSLAIALLVTSIVAVPLALKYRAQVMLPKWIASKGGYVDRVRNEDPQKVMKNAFIPTYQLDLSGTSSHQWTIFSNADWDVVHVALPISELDDDTIEILDSVHSLKYLTVRGMKDLSPPDTSGQQDRGRPFGHNIHGKPDPKELERLREICASFSSCEVFCEFKHRLKKGHTIFIY